MHIYMHIYIYIYKGIFSVKISQLKKPFSNSSIFMYYIMDMTDNRKAEKF